AVQKIENTENSKIENRICRIPKQNQICRKQKLQNIRNRIQKRKYNSNIENSKYRKQKNRKTKIQQNLITAA
ncbi:hypothetical protein VIGAN_UM003700, partial [Vigna angularis var. angularis]